MMLRFLARADAGKWLGGGLVGLTVLAWALLLHWHGEPHALHHAGSSTGQAFVASIAMWSVMILAMMLPVMLPMVMKIDQLNRAQPPTQRLSIPAFLGGYFVLWLGSAWLMATLQWSIAAALRYDPFAAWHEDLTALVLLLAGAFQFTAWKTACLHQCRSTIGFLVNHWQSGRYGSWRLGLSHARHCLGCCVLEMLVMASVGVSHAGWMGALTLALIAERYWPVSGDRVRQTIGVLLGGGGVYYLL